MNIIKITKKIQLALFLALISVIGGIVLFKYLPIKSVDGCKNPTSLEDYTDGKERLVICKDSIKLGNATVTTKKKTPGIFEYLLDEDDTWEPTHEVVVYNHDSKKYVAVFPVVNPQSWYRRAGYIFQENDNGYNLIFHRNFDDLAGRWTGVRFDENGSVFQQDTVVVNQDFGEMGPLGQRIRWTDYYIWDSAKNSYVLANNKMSFRQDDNRKYYDELDLTACGNEAPALKGKTISDLYLTRKNNERFCDDSSPVPYISNKQAAMFLKAREALREIGQGKNYSFDEIENIKLQ